MTPRSSASAAPRPHEQAPSGTWPPVRSGTSHRIAAPGLPGCFPRLFFSARSAARRCFLGGFGPGRSSDDGGIEEFPLFRDSARCAAANCSRRSATTASSAAIRSACSRILASRGSSGGPSGGASVTARSHPGTREQPPRQYCTHRQNVTIDHSPQHQVQKPGCLRQEFSDHAAELRKHPQVAPGSPHLLGAGHSKRFRRSAVVNSQGRDESRSTPKRTPQSRDLSALEPCLVEHDGEFQLVALLAETGEPPDQVSPANQDRYVVTQARKLLTDRSGGKILSKVAWADAAAEAVGPQAGLLEEIEITSDLEAGLRFGPAVPPAEVEALDCVLFDAACLEHPAIVPPGWRREVDSSAPALSDVPGCQRRVESDKVRPLFEKEEEYARAAASSWIAHPAVRGALNAVRPNAVAVTALLLPHMVDQIQCMRFCWRICGIGPVYPDGSEEPNPFDPGGPAPWPLTEREREQMAGTVARVTEISAKSDTSFDDAINVAVSRASQTLRGVTAAWVKEQNVDIEDGRIVAWKVDLLVTFVLQ